MGSTGTGTGRHVRIDSYPLAVRPIAAFVSSAAPVVDLRARASPLDEGLSASGPWETAVEYVRRFASSAAGAAPAVEVVKPFDRRKGADLHQLDQVLHALDDGCPVAFYGWWPTESAADTTEILGIDAMEVPPPDRKWSGLVDGHAVVILGYGRHDAFPGGGYVIVRNGWTGWGDAGDGFMPFTYLRAYASELRTYRLDDGPRRRTGGGGPAGADLDADIDRQARCYDPRASLTHLFFSDDLIELARARAICSLCPVRTPCLGRALERRESYGIWGGVMVIDGVAVSDKRGRGRPPKVARPRLVVDEVTGIPA